MNKKEITCSYFRLLSLSKKLIVSYFCYATEHDQSLFYNSLKRQCNGRCNKLFNYEGLPGVLGKEGYLKITTREQGNTDFCNFTSNQEILKNIQNK